MSLAHVVCNKEADIAVIKSDVSGMRSDVADIKKCLLGNGVPGLTTRTAKLEQAQTAALWFAGIIIVAIVGLAFDLFKRMITGG